MADMADLPISIIKNQLIPLAREELRLIANVDEEIKELSSTLDGIQAALKDAEERHEEHDVKRWLAELKRVSYEADDVLDEWRTEILIQRDQAQDQKVLCFSFIIQSIFGDSCSSGLYSFIHNSILRNIFASSPCRQCWVRYDIGHKIETIKESLDKVVEGRKKKLDLKQQLSIEEAAGTGSSSQNNYDLELFGLKGGRDNHDSEFFAREGIKEDMVTKLLNESAHGVIGITGMEGVGKTYLAGKLCNDARVRKHFVTIIWVNVPRPFTLVKLVQGIKIYQSPFPPAKRENDSELTGQKAKKKLADWTETLVRGKRVLVVLDNARDYKEESWSPLLRPFKETAADGSKILVTSNVENFAEVVSGVVGINFYKQKLEALSPEDSWSLFESIAPLPDKEDKQFNVLNDIGGKIVEKCDGLPLAIKAVGGHLRSIGNTKHEWETVLYSNSWKSQGLMKQVYRPLRLCYSELPPHLRGCFAYCAIFKEGDTIYTDDLVKLWIAQGFIPYSSSDNPELEAMGDGYVSILKRRSFFQVVEKDEDGKTISFSIHNTIHRFARDITDQEFAVKKIDVANESIPKTYCNRYHVLRHLTLLCPDDEAKVFPSSVYEAKGLRTLRVQPIGWRSRLGKAPPADIFSRLARLRALDLSKSDIEEFPGQVEQLIHLRYLNLSETNLEKLPEKVCNLYNLQTLGLNKCKKLVELPRGVGKMKNLRHLEISLTNKLKWLPRGIGRLTLLRTLSKFIVGGESKIGELKKLDSLRGCLEIRDIEKVANPDEAKEAEMRHKEYLHELKLKFGRSGQTDDETYDERLKGVIEALKPHQNLKKLEISGYLGTNFPNFWMTSTKLKLEVLRLYDLEKCTQLSPRGKLKHLRELEMGGMYELINIDLEFFEPMPELRILLLQDCPWLKRLLGSLHRRKLKKLNINNCPQLEWPTSLPALPLELPELEELSLTDNAGVLTESLSQTQIHLPKLKYLLINRSPHSSLPQGLGQFQELQTLEIMCCTGIDSFPDELKNLPKLQELRVNTCPTLRSRCLQEDWDKISGITNIIIDYQKIDRARIQNQRMYQSSSQIPRT